MLAVAASRLPGRLVRADAAALPLRDASVDAAVAVAAAEFTVDPARVLGEMARITRSGWAGRRRRAQPRQPVGMGRSRPQPRPYRDGCFLSGRDLLALGHHHGTAQIRGVLFAAERLPLLNRLGPLTETIGTILPRLAAVGECPGDAVDLSLKLKGRLARLPLSSMVLVGEVGTVGDELSVGPYRNERNAARRREGHATQPTAAAPNPSNSRPVAAAVWKLSPIPAANTSQLGRYLSGRRRFRWARRRGSRIRSSCRRSS